jgi:hypothetical protein
LGGSRGARGWYPGRGTTFLRGVGRHIGHTLRMAATVAPPETPAAALEADALLRAIDDRLELEGDPDARVHLERWRIRLQLDLAEALLVV